MKRQILCNTCCVIVEAVRDYCAEPGEGEYLKLVKGSAQREFLCDHCNILIHKGDICYCHSAWIPKRGIPYFEWEFNFLNNPQTCYGVRDDKVFDSEHFTLHQAGLELQRWLDEVPR